MADIEAIIAASKPAARERYLRTLPASYTTRAMRRAFDAGFEAAIAFLRASMTAAVNEVTEEEQD